MLCFLFLFLLHFFISFEYEIMIVKTREMKRNICVDGLKNKVWHDTSCVGRIQFADICRLQSTKIISVTKL